MNVYVAIFASNVGKERANHRGEEAETVRALSKAAARHKVTYTDHLVEVKPNQFEMIHTPILRKYPLRELVCIYSVPDSPREEDLLWEALRNSA